MERRAPVMSVPDRVALMAWLLLMARKLPRRHRPWSDVMQWLCKVAIVVAAVVEDGRENTEEIIKMVGKIKMIVKMTSKRYTIQTLSNKAI